MVVIASISKRILITYNIVVGVTLYITACKDALVTETRSPLLPRLHASSLGPGAGVACAAWSPRGDAVAVLARALALAVTTEGSRCRNDASSGC